MNRDEHWMRRALARAREGVAAGQTPFGACIVRGDEEEVVAAHNIVLATTDITAHAEVTAIREACRSLRTIDLAGCTIYSTCEPCPMCFAACHWANLDRIVYGASIADAARCGFRELSISNEDMKRHGGSRVIIEPGCLRDEALEMFAEWMRLPARQVY